MSVVNQLPSEWWDRPRPQTSGKFSHESGRDWRQTRTSFMSRPASRREKRTRGRRNCDGAYTVHHSGRCALDPKLRYCTEEHDGPKYLALCGRRPRVRGGSGGGLGTGAGWPAAAMPAANSAAAAAAASSASRRLQRPATTGSSFAGSRSGGGGGGGSGLEPGPGLGRSFVGADSPVTTRRVPGMAFSRSTAVAPPIATVQAWDLEGGAEGAARAQGEEEEEDEEEEGDETDQAKEARRQRRQQLQRLQPMALSRRERYVPVMFVKELADTCIGNEHAFLRLGGTPAPSAYGDVSAHGCGRPRLDLAAPSVADNMGSTVLGTPMHELLDRTRPTAYAREALATTATSSFHEPYCAGPAASRPALAELHRQMTLRQRQRPHGWSRKLKLHDLAQNQANVLSQVSAEHVPGLRRKQRLRLARSAYAHQKT